MTVVGVCFLSLSLPFFASTGLWLHETGGLLLVA